MLLYTFVRACVHAYVINVYIYIYVCVCVFELPIRCAFLPSVYTPHSFSLVFCGPRKACRHHQDRPAQEGENRSVCRRRSRLKKKGKRMLKGLTNIWMCAVPVIFFLFFISSLDVYFSPPLSLSLLFFFAGILFFFAISKVQEILN